MSDVFIGSAYVPRAELSVPGPARQATLLVSLSAHPSLDLVVRGFGAYTADGAAVPLRYIKVTGDVAGLRAWGHAHVDQICDELARQ